MGAKLRKGNVPYTQQPPESIPPNWTGPYGTGLVYVSSNPYMSANSSKFGPAKPNYVGTAPTAGAQWGLGKTAVTTAGAGNPIEFTAYTYFAPPFTAMACFRQTTAPTSGNFASLLSFGGEGSGNGWIIGPFTTTNDIDLQFGGVALYTLLTSAISVDNTYYLIISCTGNGGTATAYLYNANTRVLTVSSAIAVGTALSPTKAMTIGAAHDTVSYTEGFVGSIGAVAIWNRALTANEANKLIVNPYQLWKLPSYGRFSASVQSADPFSFCWSSW